MPTRNKRTVSDRTGLETKPDTFTFYRENHSIIILEIQQKFKMLIIEDNYLVYVRRFSAITRALPEHCYEFMIVVCSIQSLFVKTMLHHRSTVL
jgi:hypothetical protein